MLSWHFPQVSEIHVHMPHCLDFYVSVLVINWGSSDYTVEFGHEEVPVSALEEAVPAVFKGLGNWLCGLFFEDYLALWAAGFEIVNFVNFDGLVEMFENQLVAHYLGLLSTHP